MSWSATAECWGRTLQCTKQPEKLRSTSGVYEHLGSLWEVEGKLLSVSPDRQTGIRDPPSLRGHLKNSEGPTEQQDTTAAK